MNVINLTERELTIVIAALETAKREAYAASRSGNVDTREEVAELIALRNKLRDGSR